MTRSEVSARLRRHRSVCVAVLLGFSALTMTEVGVAAPDELQRSGARELARRGLESYSQRNYAEAFELFSRAESVVHAPTHLLYMARASVALGKLVKGREIYLKLSREQLPADAPLAFREAQQTANTELAAVEPRIPKLALLLQGTQEAMVLLDGQELPNALIGFPFPVDPGEHRIEGSAPNMKPLTSRVTVAEASEQRLTLEFVPVGTAASTPNATPAAPASGAAATPLETKGSAALGPSKALTIGTYVAASVGVAGLGLGTFFIVRSSSKQSDSDALFRDEKCPNCSASTKNKVIDLDQSSADAKSLATAGFVTGGVGVAAAITLYLLSRPSEPNKMASGGGFVAPYVTTNSAGLVGRF